MSSKKRSWKPQFGLRFFLLACFANAGLTGWLASNYHQYQYEQHLIKDLVEATPTNVANLQRDGKHSRLRGRMLM